MVNTDSTGKPFAEAQQDPDTGAWRGVIVYPDGRRRTLGDIHPTADDAKQKAQLELDARG